jgi:uncharacterized membrane protein YphA (DoxX/SURF4 family)
MVQLGAPVPVVAAGVATFVELPVAFAVAVGAFARPSALLMFFYTLGTALIGASLLDNNRRGSSRQHGWLLQKFQHYGRLLAVVQYWCGKRFDRCVVEHPRVITTVESQHDS